MAEWLRRLTRNQIPSGSVGSNPTDCEYPPFFLQVLNVKGMYDSCKQASQSQESIVGSVVECSPATRAARVRFPDDAKYTNLFCLLSVRTFRFEPTKAIVTLVTRSSQSHNSYPLPKLIFY